MVNKSLTNPWRVTTSTECGISSSRIYKAKLTIEDFKNNNYSLHGNNYLGVSFGLKIKTITYKYYLNIHAISIRRDWNGRTHSLQATSSENINVCCSLNTPLNTIS